MVHDSHGLHHFLTRKRELKWKRIFDKLIYVVGVIGPLMTLPQVFKIWINHQVSGVSIISWAAYLIMAFFWVIYGFIHKEKPIILTYLLWVLLDALVVLGVVVYG